MKQIEQAATKLLPPTVFKNVRQKRSKTAKIVIYIVFAIFIIYAFTLVFPFVWMLFNSVKTASEFFENIWALPEKLMLTNYLDVLTFRDTNTNMTIVGMFGLSVLITVGGTLVAVMSSSVAAYTVAKYKFAGRNLIYALAIFIMIVPVAGTLPMQYRLMKALHLYDSILGLFVLYSGAFGFNFFMLYGFFRNLSWGYAEAARVDGASHATVFFRIMLPMAKPAIIAIMVIHSINLWNDYTTPALYLKSMTTLAVGLNYLIDNMTRQSMYPQMFATMIIALIPILIVFICFQKTIMENTVAGGLKG